MSKTVFIDGGVGTTGLEIRERLEGRKDLIPVVLSDEDRRDTGKRSAALNATDFVILCLPDDAARQAVSMIDNPRTRVIDASSAHRVSDGWTYGFPELEPGQVREIAGEARVSNPGCWATCFLALVRPLVRAGLIPPDWPLSASGASGYSGGGKSLIAEFEDTTSNSFTNTAYRAYSLGLTHKHLPEMQKHARLASPPIFQPAVANTYRGMLVEVPLALSALPRKPSVSVIEETLNDAYRTSPLITVGSADVPLVRIEEHAGSDRMTLRVFGNSDTGHARLIATIDNLGKGAAGAAVQNLNIMAGLDPVAGLVI